VNLSDLVGKRGESIFTVLITKWCDGHQWFKETHLGEKRWCPTLAERPDE
jgi:hypothetical protein